MKQHGNIRWFTGRTAKIHAVRVNYRSHVIESETMCGMAVTPDRIFQQEEVDDNALCARCNKSLRAWGYAPRYIPQEQEVSPPTLPNHLLTIPGVYLSDVASALEGAGIPQTKENIEVAAHHVRSIASAYAKAVLQETTQEEWLEWIDD